MADILFKTDDYDLIGQINNVLLRLRGINTHIGYVFKWYPTHIQLNSLVTQIVKRLEISIKRNLCFILHGVAEIGIKICETDCQNRGVGRKVLSMLIGWLFRNGCSKIVLDTNVSNTRAQHVYELLGFRKVRTSTDSWRDQLGRLQSSVDYELVESDFNSYIQK